MNENEKQLIIINWMKGQGYYRTIKIQVKYQMPTGGKRQ